MLTEKQTAILDYLRTYQAQEHVPASSRMVQRKFGFSSQTTVMRHFWALATMGLVEQFSDGRWGMSTDVVGGHFTDIPVYGSIPAGAPEFTEQQPAETLSFDARVLGTKGQVWAVRVQGDSMTGAHIVEGDIAILEKREPRPGEIIAALVDETTTTLKRYLVEEGRPLLRAANDKYRDIFPAVLECQGVLIAIFRRQVARSQ